MNFPGPPSFFIKMQCIVESLEDKHFVNVSLLKLLYFSSKNDAEYQQDRQKQICAIQGHVTTLQMASTYNRKSFRKNSYLFLKHACAYLRKGCFAPDNFSTELT